ncbi:MAG: hypothetical protein V7785_10470 [Bermanella sp.]
MSTFHFPKTRWGGTAIHIGFSTILLLIVFSLIYFIWYPGALTFAGGAQNGLKIVIAVDMVLGPLLTLVVYNIAKPRKELIRDLSIIAILQIACLFAGMSLIYEQRPLVVVYDNNNFKIFDAQELKDSGIQVNLLDKFSGYYPKIVLEKAPINPEELVKYKMEKIPFFGEKVHYELWESFPQDQSSLKKLFPEHSPSNCVSRDIKSFHSKGSVCFDVQTLSFSHFQTL